jgi:hypothetical protein
MSQVDLKQPYVLGFVGENANGILRWWTQKVFERFAARGFSTKLVDLRQEGWPQEVNNCLAIAKPTFCFSFQGMGMSLHAGDNQNLWQQAKIPFVTALGDNPYHAPYLHTAHGPGTCFLYCYEDFLQTYQHYLKGKAYATTLCLGHPENPYADRTPWEQREHDIVFVKTGVNPQTLRKTWEAVPSIIQKILHECADLVLRGIDQPVETICAQVFADKKIHWGDRLEVFLSTCSFVDFYARAVRAERMVLALMRHNALIVGDWSHLDKSNSRARFQGPIAAGELDDLYAKSKILVNTLPTVRFGLHERILAGFFAKTAVISDTTPFLQKKLEHCSSFFGLDIDQPNFTEALDHTVTSCLADPDTARKIEATAELTKSEFSFDGYVQQIIEHLRVAVYSHALSGWHYQPVAAC